MFFSPFFPSPNVMSHCHGLMPWTENSTKHGKESIANSTLGQRYTYRVLQTLQMKLILLCVWAEPAVLGSSKTALKFKYEI